MLFPSEVFLFVFLPLVLAVYYIFLRKTKELKNIFLLAASLFFYAWGEPVYVFLMIAAILINWLYGMAVHHFEGKRGTGSSPVGGAMKSHSSKICTFSSVGRATDS